MAANKLHSDFWFKNDLQCMQCIRDARFQCLTAHQGGNAFQCSYTANDVPNAWLVQTEESQKGGKRKSFEVGVTSLSTTMRSSSSSTAWLTYVSLRIITSCL